MRKFQPCLRMINSPKQRRTAEQAKTLLSKLDVAAVLGIIAVCAFVASRFYVEGISQSLGYDLNSYLNIQDYVQLSSSWMSNPIWLVAIFSIGILLLSPRVEKYRLKMWEYLGRKGFPLAKYLITERRLLNARGINKWFRDRRRYFIPVLILFSWCLYAFSAGSDFSRYYIRKAPVTSIQLSDNRIFEGRILRAVSRYIILLRDGNILTILPQTGISRVMVYLPREK
jgi:hypothetical protein